MREGGRNGKSEGDGRDGVEKMNEGGSERRYSTFEATFSCWKRDGNAEKSEDAEGDGELHVDGLWEKGFG